MNIKDLDLTEEDFKMIIEGLESLPEKGIIQELTMDMLRATATKDQRMQDKIAAETRAKLNKRIRDMEAKKDDIDILKGKIVMLKRHLLEQGALRQANDVLNKKS
jgi:hypothetical protein